MQTGFTCSLRVYVEEDSSKPCHHIWQGPASNLSRDLWKPEGPVMDDTETQANEACLVQIPQESKPRHGALGWQGS